MSGTNIICSVPFSGRHGHSVVLDNRRNRLVLFGGGSGSDLLRSGEDNSEVWELKMNDDWETSLKVRYLSRCVHVLQWFVKLTLLLFSFLSE